MSSPGARAEERSKEEVAGTLTDSQDCMNDGLGLLSRVSGLLTVAFISFYLAAIFVENWSSAESQVNTVLDATSNAVGTDLSAYTTLNSSDYTYSLDSYCVDVPIPAWNMASHQVCFKYMDNVEFCNADGEDCEKLTGCERFGNICYVRQVVKIALAAGIILGVVCGAYSEKGHPFTTSVQFLAMVAGIVAMVMWVDWSQRELKADAGKLKLGLGGWLITIGWLLAFLAMVVGYLDEKICCVSNAIKAGLSNDGISMSSRVGSILSVTVWICCLISVANPQWTTVSNLGTVGMYNTPGTNATVSGSFGVWRYCIDQVVPQFGTEPQQVCVDWTDNIAITGSLDATACNIAATLVDAAEVAAAAASAAVLAGEDVAAAVSVGGSGDSNDDLTSAATAAGAVEGCGTSGIERFADFGIKDQRRLTGVMILAAACLAIIADVYSEKNIVGVIFMFLSAMSGMVGFASWVNFQMKLTGKNGDASGIKFDEGGWVLVAAWIGALISFACYFNALRDHQANPQLQAASVKGPLARRTSKSHV